MSEHTPFRQQHLDSQITRAIAKSLDRARAQGRVAKSSGVGKPGQEDARPDHRPGAPVTRRIDPLPHGPAQSVPASTYKAPADPHFHVAMEHGATVAVTVNKTEHIGRLVDWSEQGDGVRVATRAGTINARKHHLRPVSEDELAEHRKREQDERDERARREDEDQEQRGVRTSMYATEDIIRGHHVVCVGDDDEETEGEVQSVSHDGPDPHVVVKSYRDGKPRLTVHHVHHVREIRNPALP